jgi:sugar lactone lactonase YvrE
MNPLRGWSVDRAQVTFVGEDLQRPECVLAEPGGTLWSADARGGVMRIDPDGTQQLVAQTVVQSGRDGFDENSVARYILEGTLPNGLAFDGEGDFVIANFGTDAIERMTRDGHSETLFTEIEGQPIGKANFALADARGWMWREIYGPPDLGGVPDGFAFDERTMTPEVLGGGRGTLAPMMASVTFGGPDLKTVYLGSLMGSRLPSFRSPAAGLPLTHWHD